MEAGETMGPHPRMHAFDVGTSPAHGVGSGSGRGRKIAAAVSGVLGLLCISAAVVAALRARPQEENGATVGMNGATIEILTFDQFVLNFERSYKLGSDEYTRRAAIFQQSVLEIEEANDRILRKGDLWGAGVHPFMDWTAAERKTMRGYKKAKRSRGTPLPSKWSSEDPLDWTAAERKTMRGYKKAKRSGSTPLSSKWSSEDPDSRGPPPAAGGTPKTEGPLVRNQGGCGSCWAFAASEAAEAVLLKSNPELKPADIRISEQAILECTPNPQECGGTGGCMGATEELAWDWFRDRGAPLNVDRPYMGDDSGDNKCILKEDGIYPYPATTLIRAEGWSSLGRNTLATQKNLQWALVEHGPVAVAVAANYWEFYTWGVFNCMGDPKIDHAVLAKGYGSEGRMYWLIQNSWGPNWGESGHIRLQWTQAFQADPDDLWCGMDDDNEIGMGCKGDPESIEVCGACGILFDPVMPLGVRIERIEKFTALV